MILHCPCCHARFSIEMLAQDEAARELLALRLSPALLAYLGLFRSPQRALAFDRALKLAREVLELAPPDEALAETVEALRGKGPLKNHNYLKRVMEGLARRSAGAVQANIPRDASHPNPPRSKGEAALDALAAWGAGDWVRSGIADGLRALVAMRLPGSPAAELITCTADTWHVALARAMRVEEVDRPRLMEGFARLIAECREWPAPSMLMDRLPARPRRTAVGHAQGTDPEIARRMISEIIDRIGR